MLCRTGTAGTIRSRFVAEGDCGECRKFPVTRQRAALISVISNTSLVLMKIAAGAAMGSISVISEAIHSGIDLIASLVAYVSIKKSNEPADDDHPYGHGKYENISGFFEAILIFVAAAMIIYEAGKKLMYPADIEGLGWGIGVMGISTAVNILVSRTLYRIAKREHSIALEADAMHLSVDVFTSLGVLAGLAAIKLTDIHLLDPAIALVVAAMILRGSWGLTRRTLDDLADKALPEEDVATVKEILARYPMIHNFHRLRTRRSGRQREIDIHIHIDGTTDVNSAHDLCNKIETDIKGVFSETYVVIHVEPCRHP
jgi:cation diffusion facilitator family transporter